MKTVLAILQFIPTVLFLGSSFVFPFDSSSYFSQVGVLVLQQIALLTSGLATQTCLAAQNLSETFFSPGANLTGGTIQSSCISHYSPYPIVPEDIWHLFPL